MPSEADIFQREGVRKAVFLLSGAYILKQHGSIEMVEQQSSGARRLSQQGPSGIVEKPSKITRAFPIAVLNVHAVMEGGYKHTGDVITRNYLHAQSQNKSAVGYEAMSYGAVSPKIFVKEGIRLLPAVSTKGKLCWMTELQWTESSERLASISQSSLTLGSVACVYK